MKSGEVYEGDIIFLVRARLLIFFFYLLPLLNCIAEWRQCVGKIPHRCGKLNTLPVATSKMTSSSLQGHGGLVLLYPSHCLFPCPISTPFNPMQTKIAKDGGKSMTLHLACLKPREIGSE